MGLLTVVAIVLAPALLFGAWGLLRARESTGDVSFAARAPRDPRLLSASALLYTLGFNLMFFIQEVFLVVPKALVPGLNPTLYHNNHAWSGDDPIASLFQGTGALAIFLAAIACAVWFARRPPRSTVMRLFVLWMIFHGFFMSLPQVVFSAVFAGNDVAMAMDYLGASPAVKLAAAVLAIIAMGIVGVRITRPLLELAPSAAEVSTAGARSRFAFHVATLPALIGLAITFLFRVPADWYRITIFPTLVTLFGIAWIQASAWRASPQRAGEALPVRSLRGPLVAVVVLLLFFQVVLRPGVAFY